MWKSKKGERERESKCCILNAYNTNIYRPKRLNMWFFDRAPYLCFSNENRLRFMGKSVLLNMLCVCTVQHIIYCVWILNMQNAFDDYKRTNLFKFLLAAFVVFVEAISPGSCSQLNSQYVSVRDVWTRLIQCMRFCFCRLCLSRHVTLAFDIIYFN